MQIVEGDEGKTTCVTRYGAYMYLLEKTYSLDIDSHWAESSPQERSMPIT